MSSSLSLEHSCSTISPSLSSPSSSTSSSSLTLLRQGAEAKLYRTSYLGRDCIVKERFVKGYRHPELDAKIRMHQIRTEVRCIAKARKLGIIAPALYMSNPEEGRIHMEYLDAPTARDFINKLDLSQETDVQKATDLARLIGEAIASLHAGKIIHGDLTTSNMLVFHSEFKGDKDTAAQGWGKPERLALIDFGLSYDSSIIEDKAVDLYVLERALLSTHPNTEFMFKETCNMYQRNQKGTSKVLQKLIQVRARGRKRTMVG
eukprot:gb/GEZN01013863.1/.p1 GENE.gb/GEZN01013863.1/~~gb/GEZN01013863.1/.p1  ORF type:complete len:261 (+),score=38.46 gb/GEZN01013863.1/:83-865(+)